MTVELDQGHALRATVTMELDEGHPNLYQQAEFKFQYKLW